MNPAYDSWGHGTWLHIPHKGQALGRARDLTNAAQEAIKPWVRDPLILSETLNDTDLRIVDATARCKATKLASNVP